MATENTMFQETNCPIATQFVSSHIISDETIEYFIGKAPVLPELPDFDSYLLYGKLRKEYEEKRDLLIESIFCSEQKDIDQIRVLSLHEADLYIREKNELLIAG